jgi:hypothetical protein
MVGQYLHIVKGLLESLGEKISKFSKFEKGISFNSTNEG